MIQRTMAARTTRGRQVPLTWSRDRFAAAGLISTPRKVARLRTCAPFSGRPGDRMPMASRFVLRKLESPHAGRNVATDCPRHASKLAPRNQPADLAEAACHYVFASSTSAPRAIAWPAVGYPFALLQAPCRQFYRTDRALPPPSASCLLRSPLRVHSSHSRSVMLVRETTTHRR